MIKSAKRSKKEKNGLHAWHPYYAGYSEQFVVSAIQKLTLGKNSLVLDPWGGSGTTCVVCESNGIPSIGMDINPIMSRFISAKTKFTLEYLLVHGSKEVEKIILYARKNMAENGLADNLDLFLSRSFAIQIESLLNAVDVLCKSDRYNKKTNLKLKKALKDKVTPLDPIKSFYECVILCVARQLAGYKSGSNPTWFKKINRKPSYTNNRIATEFRNAYNQMFADLLEFYEDSHPDLTSLSLIADSRKIPLNANTVDAIITSPPYLTRIDYAMTTQLELLLCGYSDTLRCIRENTMGAPVITNIGTKDTKMWGEICEDILSQVGDHTSKASKTYYLKNIVQYFSDAHRSLLEIKRVLKKGKTALIVVQSSYYKDVEIPLGEIYVQMGRKLGFKASIVFSEEVKNHIAHVNKRSSVYKKNKTYHETVVQLIK